MTDWRSGFAVAQEIKQLRCLMWSADFQEGAGGSEERHASFRGLGCMTVVRDCTNVVCLGGWGGYLGLGFVIYVSRSRLGNPPQGFLL